MELYSKRIKDLAVKENLLFSIKKIYSATTKGETDRTTRKANE